MNWRPLRLTLLGLGLIAVAGLYVSSAVLPAGADDAPVPPAIVHPASAEVVLQVRVAAPGRVLLSWQLPNGLHPKALTLYRSTTDLSVGKLDIVHNPVAVIGLRPDDLSAVDPTVPDNVTCYYQLQVDREFSPVVSVALPNRPFPTLTQPSLWVDKLAYTLEVRDGNVTVKRYPIALGRNPRRRKLHHDNASTPEGVYEIAGVQAKATYYRAFDVNYPDDVDQVRYDAAVKQGIVPDEGDGQPEDIGGDIQIHGQGIQHNWTFGCMALRNADMDELFSHPELAVGTPLVIVGTEITAADVSSTPTDVQWATIEKSLPGLDRNHPDAKTLAIWQVSQHLPVTGLLDSHTIQTLTEATP